MDPSLKVRAFSHLLGECGVIFAVGRKTAMRYRGNFPQCLNGAPMLLPTDNTAFRRNLDFWFESKGIRRSCWVSSKITRYYERLEKAEQVSFLCLL